MKSTQSQSQSKAAPDVSRASLQTGWLQRKCACGNHTIAGGECDECGKQHHALQRAARNPELGTRNSQPETGNSAGVPSIVHEVLNSSGRPLDPTTRAFFEPRFGHDFSRVRVHTDARAAESARAVDAVAYTFGRDIVFAANHHQPTTPDGQHLLAHELTHVIQQAGLNNSASADSLGQRGEAAEREAKSTASRLMHGLSPNSITASDGTIRRQQPGEGRQPAAEPAGPARNVPYRVVAGDTLGSIAQRFGTTVAALRTLNNLRGDSVRAGQLLQVPQTQGCALPVPGDADTQILAAAIFGEAEAARVLNDEREAIAWAFLNSVQHTASICDGSICPQLSSTARRAQCNRDRRDLGSTVLDAVRTGSRAFNGNRWRMVMFGNAMLPEGNLCLLSPASEIEALRSAINTASAVNSATTPANNYVRFNRAANQPPSDRMESAAAIAGHTFYRFIPNRECG